MFEEEWKGFKGGHWTDEVNVRDFIQENYEPYEGDASFLVGPTKATEDLWNKVQTLLSNEEKLNKMAQAAKSIGMPDAADQIAKTILDAEC